MFRVVARKSDLKRQSECAIKLMDYVPNLQKLFFDLRHSAKHVGIILGKRSYSGKSREFSCLLVAIIFCRIGISLGEFAVAVRLSGIYLRMMRAVHRLHGKNVSF